MPDARLAKARATLPEGYQFGDARGPILSVSMDAFTRPTAVYESGRRVPPTPLWIMEECARVLNRA